MIGIYGTVGKSKDAILLKKNKRVWLKCQILFFTPKNLFTFKAKHRTIKVILKERRTKSMVKKIKDCTVDELYIYRLINLNKINGKQLEDLPFAIVIFLKNPDLAKMTKRDKGRMFKRYLYEISPAIGEETVDIEIEGK